MGDSEKCGNKLGPRGKTGPEGPQGIEGERGIQGPIGETGQDGQDGAQGIQGDPGPQGIQGPVGPQGIQGDPGPQGIQGPQGVQGPQGIQGPAGADGQDGTGTGDMEHIGTQRAEGLSVALGSSGVSERSFVTSPIGINEDGNYLVMWGITTQLDEEYDYTCELIKDNAGDVVIQSKQRLINTDATGRLTDDCTGHYYGAFVDGDFVELGVTSNFSPGGTEAADIVSYFLTVIKVP